MWKLWTAPSVCISRTLQAIAVRRLGPNFHRTRLPCTGFSQHPVGTVGNLAPLQPISFMFSKSPDFDRQDLENSPTLKPTLLQLHRMNSHISSSNYDYYYFLSIFFLRFSPPVMAHLEPRPRGFISEPTNLGAPGLDFETWEVTNRTLYRTHTPSRKCAFHGCRGHGLAGQTARPAFRQMRPVFPRARIPARDYNQREEKTAVSAAASVVVECGKSRNLTSGA